MVRLVGAAQEVEGTEQAESGSLPFRRPPRVRASLQGARNPRAGLFRQMTTTNNDPARRKEQYDGWTRTDEMAEAGDRLHVLEQNRRVA
jgi:hypothetical protein